MSKWKSIGKFALSIAKIAIPQVQQVEDAAKALKAAKDGPAKLAAVEDLTFAGIEATEFVADKDLLDDAQVKAAFRGFVSSYVTFQNALAAAKAAKP